MGGNVGRTLCNIPYCAAHLYHNVVVRRQHYPDCWFAHFGHYRSAEQPTLTPQRSIPADHTHLIGCYPVLLCRLDIPLGCGWFPPLRLFPPPPRSRYAPQRYTGQTSSFGYYCPLPQLNVYAVRVDLLPPLPPLVILIGDTPHIWLPLPCPDQPSSPGG